MFQFGWLRKKRDAIEAEFAQALGGIVNEHFAGMRKDIAAIGKLASLKAERDRLLESIETVKREKARHDEDHERKIRDTEHKVGLVQKQHEAEMKIAKREVALEVKEQTLDADRQRFEDQMKFEREKTQEQIKQLHGMIKPLLKALPTAEMMLTVHREEEEK
jgi:hypothetical protein